MYHVYIATVICVNCLHYDTHTVTVIGDDDSHHKKVKFVDGSVQSVSNRHVIPTGGATSRPSLQVKDHVILFSL